MWIYGTKNNDVGREARNKQAVIYGYMCDWLHVWLVTCVIGYICDLLHVWLVTCVIG
jgi:hypothetical protein